MHSTSVLMISFINIFYFTWICLPQQSPTKPDVLSIVLLLITYLIRWKRFSFCSFLFATPVKISVWIIIINSMFAQQAKYYWHVWFEFVWIITIHLKNKFFKQAKNNYYSGRPCKAVRWSEFCTLIDYLIR